jgi:sugar O-acyltransferase (sialic acid O-acetyltransferase NeuD family)
MQKIALVGSTSLSARLAHYFAITGFGDTVGMFDDFEPIGSVKYARPVLGPIDSIPAFFKKGAFDAVSIAVAYNQRNFRQQVYAFLKRHGVRLATFVHPSSFVEPSAVVGEGSTVLVKCVIDMGARLRENVFMSSHGFVSHDVEVGAHTYLGPSVNLAGGTRVGPRCFIGIATTTIDGISVGSNVQTAAGAVITRPVADDCLVAGVPAVIKKRFDAK